MLSCNKYLHLIYLGKSIITKVQSLDWLKQDATIKHPEPGVIENGNTDIGMKCQEYDVILGSDIVYERTLILPLCKILKTYLKIIKSNISLNLFRFKKG